MPKFESFDQVSQQALAYFDDEETLQKAYDLLTEAAPQFPEQAAITYNWRYCAAAMMNKTELALQLIQESLEAGFWWSAAYLTSDDDLKSLQELPEFKRLVEISEAKHQAAQAKAKPLALELPQPAAAKDGQPLPLLLALHGNAANAQRSVEYWESAVAQGWRTVLLQSSQIFGPEAYVWDDLEQGAREIEAHYQDLTNAHPPVACVVGGFSKGGEMAIWLALKEVIPLAGFIAVNPGGPLINAPESWLPLIEGCGTLGQMRTTLLAGENDQNLPNIQTLHEMLTSRGLDCQLIVAPDIGHDFPADFEQTLASTLQYIQKG